MFLANLVISGLNFLYGLGISLPVKCLAIRLKVVTVYNFFIISDDLV